MIGQTISHYRILEKLGAASQGEVYRAYDTQKDRDVAFKVLPSRLVSDNAELVLFMRQARTLSALFHSNILHVFDVGSEGGIAFVVTELLEGETLRARLAQGALPARRAVDLAVQIAEGLGAAHEKGIVHRDLKPENIFVTGDGRAKVLDFGLAKRTDSASSPSASMQATSGHTGPGMVLGTAAYMSPEQVRGEAVDHRSDIFSFGAVLYELLTGRQAFGRETATESMTAILKEDPPEIAAGDSNSASSPGLQRIVQHCLEKKPGERFQSARDIAFALQALSGSVVASRPAIAITRTAWRRWLAVAVGAALLGVVGLATYRQGEMAGMRSAAERISFTQRSFRPQAIFKAAFMPDGETIVYSAALEGNAPELFAVRAESPAPQALGFPRTHLLSVSSRGELAVLTNAQFVFQRLFTGTLARMSLGGTAPREVLANVREADWSPDGSALAVIREANGQDCLEFPIGKVLYQTGGYLSDLRVSPRGDRVALFEHPVRWDDRGSVIVVDLHGSRTLLSSGYTSEQGLSWSQTGDEVFFSATTVALALNVYGVDLSGRLRVALRSPGGLTIHDVSRTGRWLVTRDGRRAGISILAPGARTERDLDWLDLSYSPYLSPDGRMLLFDDESVSAGLNYMVSLRPTEGGAVVRLGEGEAFGFSPDGTMALAIVYTPPQIVIYPTGPGEPLRLPRGSLEAFQWASWYPDGKSILFCGHEAGKASRCYAQDLSGGLPRPVTPEATTNGLVSPDGRRIFYSTSAGTQFIQDAQGGKAQLVVGLTTDDSVIRWSVDGRSLHVFNGAAMPYRFEKLDPASGRRVLVREVAPVDRAGVSKGEKAALTDDASVCAYGYTRMTSQLFVVEGAR
jgi:Tol biopolymer transport system component